MEIFLPVAGVHVNGLLIISFASVVGFLSGMFGVGGGFLLTPAMIMIGIPSAVAAASDSTQIVASSFSGLLAHRRLGKLDWKLGLVIVCGGLAGGLAGTLLVYYLRARDVFDLFLHLAYVVLLFSIGTFMLIESIRAIMVKEKESRNRKLKFLSALPGRVRFSVSGVECPVYVLVGLGFGVGVLAALMGVGGGFLMLPILIYLVGIPTVMAVGTNLITVLFTSVIVAFSQSMINHTVDLLLALLILICSSCGAQVGASVCHSLKPNKLRLLFSLVVFGVVVMLMRDLLVPSAQLITVVCN